MKRVELKTNHLVIDGQKHNYIADYLETLGIKKEDCNSFIEAPREEDADDPEKLDNMIRAVDTAYEMLTKGAITFLEVDSDVDGYTSSSIIINYLKKRFPAADIRHSLHPGKEHGIDLTSIPNEASLIIIPDAGTNDYEQQNKLIESGKTVIILDHHEVSNEKEFLASKAIIVNDQHSSNFSNNQLSGAGVAFMFIEEMDKKYFDGSIYKNYIDLAAIGIISDVMDTRTLGNNYIIYYGLKNIKSRFIKEVIKAQEHGIKNVDSPNKIDIAFYVAPVINGTVRSGTDEDKATVFQAMTSENDNELYPHEWRGKTIDETIYQKAARLALNAKGRQDMAKKKSLAWLSEMVESNHWDKDNIIIVPIKKEDSDKINPNITGLVAMELEKKYNRPCIVVRETDFNGLHAYAGSGRNGDFFGVEDLLDFLNRSNHVLMVAGHPNAFGVAILGDEIDKLREYANKNIKQTSFSDSVYFVDYWFHTGEAIDRGMLFDLASCDDIYGCGIPQPKIAFDFDYSPSEIKVMGKDGSSVKIKHNGIDFVCFKDKEFVDKIQNSGCGHITVIGRPQLNE